jgi:hypothetical protein
LGIALLANGAEQLGPKAKGIKRSNGFLLHSAWEGVAFDRFRQMLF